MSARAAPPPTLPPQITKFDDPNVMKLTETKEHKTDVAKAAVRTAIESFAVDERSGGGLVGL